MHITLDHAISLLEIFPMNILIPENACILLFSTAIVCVSVHECAHRKERGAIYLLIGTILCQLQYSYT